MDPDLAEKGLMKWEKLMIGEDGKLLEQFGTVSGNEEDIGVDVSEDDAIIHFKSR